MCTCHFFPTELFVKSVKYIIKFIIHHTSTVGNKMFITQLHCRSKFFISLNIALSQKITLTDKEVGMVQRGTYYIVFVILLDQLFINIARQLVQQYFQVRKCIYKFTINPRSYRWAILNCNRERSGGILPMKPQGRLFHLSL